jgi:hypothetical protein
MARLFVTMARPGFSPELTVLAHAAAGHGSRCGRQLSRQQASPGREHMLDVAGAAMSCCAAEQS